MYLHLPQTSIGNDFSNKGPNHFGLASIKAEYARQPEPQTCNSLPENRKREQQKMQRFVFVVAQVMRVNRKFTSPAWLDPRWL
jgi:hypothetical protein